MAPNVEPAAMLPFALIPWRVFLPAVVLAVVGAVVVLVSGLFIPEIIPPEIISILTFGGGVGYALGYIIGLIWQLASGESLSGRWVVVMIGAVPIGMVLLELALFGPISMEHNRRLTELKALQPSDVIRITFYDDLDFDTAVYSTTDPSDVNELIHVTENASTYMPNHESGDEELNFAIELENGRTIALHAILYTKAPGISHADFIDHDSYHFWYGAFMSDGLTEWLTKMSHRIAKASILHKPDAAIHCEPSPSLSLIPAEPLALAESI